MNSLLTISLTNLRFFAYHGLYAEEKKTGNQFEINLTVSYTPTQGIITDISDTINYVSLYELLKKEMQQPRGLLETLAMEISEKIHAGFPLIKEIEISIAKTQPPIAGFVGEVGVRLSKQY
jgi:7,8-dihydroneopterin aldolase/epimerase/oxygenase